MDGKQGSSYARWQMDGEQGSGKLTCSLRLPEVFGTQRSRAPDWAWRPSGTAALPTWLPFPGECPGSPGEAWTFPCSSLGLSAPSLYSTPSLLSPTVGSKIGGWVRLIQWCIYTSLQLSSVRVNVIYIIIELINASYSQCPLRSSKKKSLPSK